MTGLVTAAGRSAPNRDPKTGRFVKAAPSGAMRVFEMPVPEWADQSHEGIRLAEQMHNQSNEMAGLNVRVRLVPSHQFDAERLRAFNEGFYQTAYVKERWPEAYRDPSAPEPRRPWYRRAIGWLAGER